MKSRIRTMMGAATVVGALAIGFVGGWEGKRNVAYLDIVGVPTVCFGETRGVEIGDRYSDDECKVMLGDALVEFEQGMRTCMAKPDSVPDKPYVAFLSWTYNVGVGAACKSTLMRKVNAGDIRGACNELSRWNRAGGQVVKGLTLRRAEERALCLSGL